MKTEVIKKIILLLGLGIFIFPINSYSGAADELRNAKFEERTRSAAAGFEAAMNGLKKFPQDRNLFLYALELSEEASDAQLETLSKQAMSMADKYPKDYAWNLGACRVKRLQGKPEEALQYCLLALQYGRTEFQTNLEIAKTYLAMKIFDRAEEFINYALEISPADFDALYTRGEIYETQGFYLKARKSYSEALSAAGNDISAKSDANASKASQAMSRAKAGRKKQQNRAAAKKAREHLGAAAEACTKKFNEELNKKDFTAAAETGKACMKKNPLNYRLSAKLADVLVNAGEYEEAVDEYERAQRLAAEDHKEYAVLCIKQAETLIRLEDRKAAEEKYRMAAASAPFDSETLVKVADYFLKQSSYKEALHYYSSALQIDPGNAKARSNAERLQLDMMSDEEIIEELQKRKAINPKVKTLTEKDLSLHRNIRAAEAAGAVELLRRKFPGNSRLYYEENENGIKIRLTLEGYNAYARAVSRDAVKYFEGKGISLREIFKLRDSNGDPIFDKTGQITPEGLNAWSLAKNTGKITWIFSYQPVPGSKKQIQSTREIIQLSKIGYREISEPEYLWLLKATNCPPDVLASPQVKLKEVNDGAINHYLICYQPMPSPCATVHNEGLPAMIEGYRQGNTEIADGYSSSFFGTGGVKRHRLCEKGKLWTAPE